MSDERPTKTPVSRRLLKNTRSSPASAFIVVVIITIAYYAAARLSLFLALGPTNTSPIWPPSGIALAGVLMLGYRIGPGIFLGAFFANIFVLESMGFSPSAAMATAILTAAGSTLEAFVGATLIYRYNGERYAFETIGSTLVFVVSGAILGPMVSAAIGVNSICWLLGDWSHYHSALLTWWLGNAAGVMLVAPLFLSVANENLSEALRGKMGEALLLLFLLFCLSAMTFVWNYPLGFLIVPLLLWIIMRFSLFEVCLALAIASGMVIWGALRKGYTLTGDVFNEPLLLLQAEIGVFAVTALLLAVMVDERLRSRKALEAEKVFTDTIINSVPGMFYVLDANGRLIRWNHFLEELSDMSAEELSSMESLRNILNTDQTRISGKIAQAFAKGESEAEGSLRTKGGMRHFLFTGKRIDTLGDPYVVGTGIDITERKSAELQIEEYRKNLETMVAKRTTELTKVNIALEDEIRERRQIERNLVESEVKYRDLVESVNSAILQWTQEGKITFINRFAERFFGYPREEIVGKSIIGTIVPETESSGRDLSHLARDIFENADSYIHNENENIRRNGERVWVAWTNRPIMDKNGVVVGILSVGNDITGRKQAEDRLQLTLEELAMAKERAEAADHLKSAFLATMSHELRTPLNSIIGFTGIILQGYVGPLNEEQTKQLGMVRNSANHLLSLINDVLDISKIEAGQLQVSRELFDLPAAIEQAVQSSRPALDKKGLSLVVTIDPTIGGMVSDRRRVEQVLLNLLSNAVKFTDQGSIAVDCRREEGLVTIGVTDTGIGIKEENMARLFKAFQQVDTGTARRYEGTGLGLYICQRLAELLGGRMHVTSEWGKGSIFCFSLPDEGAMCEEKNSYY
ncbi:MAG: MASE1 domain-containing protein [Syntrophales bacterium]|nr:MASE1 domain-containing protein [Syntrophales bacterium]